MIVIGSFYVLSWIFWRYAVWISAELEDKTKVMILPSDIGPAFFITFSYLFLLPWGGSGTSVSRLGVPRRLGGPCSPECVTTLVGTFGFWFGFFWGCSIPLHRIFFPLPNQPQPTSYIPGVLYLMHVLLLGGDAFLIRQYVQIPANDRTIIGGSSSESNQEEDPEAPN